MRAVFLTVRFLYLVPAPSFSDACFWLLLSSSSSQLFWGTTSVPPTFVVRDFSGGSIFVGEMRFRGVTGCSNHPFQGLNHRSLSLSETRSRREGGWSYGKKRNIL